MKLLFPVRFAANPSSPCSRRPRPFLISGRAEQTRFAFRELSNRNHRACPTFPNFYSQSSFSQFQFLLRYNVAFSWIYSATMHGIRVLHELCKLLKFIKLLNINADFVEIKNISIQFNLLNFWRLRQTFRWLSTLSKWKGFFIFSESVIILSSSRKNWVWGRNGPHAIRFARCA